MMDPDKVTALMEGIAEVNNLSRELGIDLDDFCCEAVRKAMTGSVALDAADVRMILRGYSDGPTGLQ